MKEFKDKAFFSTSEVAKLIGVSRVTIFNRIKRGEINADKVGKTYLIPRSEIIGYLDRGELTDKQKRELESQVNFVIKTYGKAIRMLGKE